MGEWKQGFTVIFSYIGSQKLAWATRDLVSKKSNLQHIDINSSAVRFGHRPPPWIFVANGIDKEKKRERKVEMLVILV